MHFGEKRLFWSRVSNGAFLADLAAAANEANLFMEERHTLQDLLNVRITNSMLEGW